MDDSSCIQIGKVGTRLKDGGESVGVGLKAERLHLVEEMESFFMLSLAGSAGDFDDPMAEI